METSHIIKIIWLGFVETVAAKHMPSVRNLAKWKHMFTFNTMNYHTINNFGKITLINLDWKHVRPWEKFGCSYPAKPKVWHYTPFEQYTACFISNGWADTKHTVTRQRGNRGVSSRTWQQGTGTSTLLFIPDVPNTGSYRFYFSWARAKEKVIRHTPHKHISNLR